MPAFAEVTRSSHLSIPVERTVGGGGDGVFVDEALNSVGAEASSGPSRKQRVVGSAGAFAGPHFENCFGWSGERDSAAVSAFAET